MAWPFERGTLVPPPAIHPDDLDMVGERDYEWWSRLTTQRYQQLWKANTISHLATFRLSQQQFGMDAEGATNEVRRRFPSYYANLESRASDLYAGAEEDRLLPVILMDRIDRGTSKASVRQKITREILAAREIRPTATVNSWFRAAIRNGQL